MHCDVTATPKPEAMKSTCMSIWAGDGPFRLDFKTNTGRHLWYCMHNWCKRPNCWRKLSNLGLDCRPKPCQAPENGGPWTPDLEKETSHHATMETELLTSPHHCAHKWPNVCQALPEVQLSHHIHCMSQIHALPAILRKSWKSNGKAAKQPAGTRALKLSPASKGVPVGVSLKLKLTWKYKCKKDLVSQVLLMICPFWTERLASQVNLNTEPPAIDTLSKAMQQPSLNLSGAAFENREPTNCSQIAATHRPHCFRFPAWQMLLAVAQPNRNRWLQRKRDTVLRLWPWTSSAWTACRSPPLETSGRVTLKLWGQSVFGVQNKSQAEEGKTWKNNMSLISVEARSKKARGSSDSIKNLRLRKQATRLHAMGWKIQSTASSKLMSCNAIVDLSKN